jgi:hypothetical protein
MRRLMLRSTQEIVSRGELKKGGPTEAIGKQHQQHSKGVDGQLHMNIWDPGGFQLQGSHEQELMIFVSGGV